MNAFEIEMVDLGHDIGTLQADELDLVSGGAGNSFAIDIGTSERITRPVVAFYEEMSCCWVTLTASWSMMPKSGYRFSENIMLQQ
jgi:hypothetical protein